MKKLEWLPKYFEEHNIPYHMVNGFRAKDDDTSIDTPKFINMTCNRCKKSQDMPYDIYMEMLDYQNEFEESQYLEIACIYCNKGTMK